MAKPGPKKADAKTAKDRRARENQKTLIHLAKSGNEKALRAITKNGGVSDADLSILDID